MPTIGTGSDYPNVDMDYVDLVIAGVAFTAGIEITREFWPADLVCGLDPDTTWTVVPDENDPDVDITRFTVKFYMDDGTTKTYYDEIVLQLEANVATYPDDIPFYVPDVKIRDGIIEFKHGSQAADKDGVTYYNSFPYKKTISGAISISSPVATNVGAWSGTPLQANAWCADTTKNDDCPVDYTCKNVDPFTNVHYTVAITDPFSGNNPESLHEYYSCSTRYTLERFAIEHAEDAGLYGRDYLKEVAEYSLRSFPVPPHLRLQEEDTVWGSTTLTTTWSDYNKQVADINTGRETDDRVSECLRTAQVFALQGDRVYDPEESSLGSECVFEIQPDCDVKFVKQLAMTELATPPRISDVAKMAAALETGQEHWYKFIGTPTNGTAWLVPPDYINLDIAGATVGASIDTIDGFAWRYEPNGSYGDGVVGVPVNSDSVSLGQGITNNCNSPTSWSLVNSSNSPSSHPQYDLDIEYFFEPLPDDFGPWDQWIEIEVDGVVVSLLTPIPLAKDYCKATTISVPQDSIVVIRFGSCSRGFIRSVVKSDSGKVDYHPPANAGTDPLYPTLDIAGATLGAYAETVDGIEWYFGPHALVTTIAGEKCLGLTAADNGNGTTYMYFTTDPTHKQYFLDYDFFCDTPGDYIEVYIASDGTSTLAARHEGSSTQTTFLSAATITVPYGYGVFFLMSGHGGSGDHGIRNVVKTIDTSGGGGATDTFWRMQYGETDYTEQSDDTGFTAGTEQAWVQCDLTIEYWTAEAGTYGGGGNEASRCGRPTLDPAKVSGCYELDENGDTVGSCNTDGSAYNVGTATIPAWPAEYTDAVTGEEFDFEGVIEHLHEWQTYVAPSSSSQSDLRLTVHTLVYKKQYVACWDDDNAPTVTFDETNRRDIYAPLEDIATTHASTITNGNGSNVQSVSAVSESSFSVTVTANTTW